MTYSSAIRPRQDSSFKSAMAMMQGNDFNPSAVGSNGAENRLKAIEKANAWTQQGVQMAGSTADFGTQMAGQAASAGMQLVTSNVIHEANMEAARAQQAAAQRSGTMGAIGSIIGIGASLLCERRMKGDIQQLDPALAWKAVRDLPYYSFRYKANPGPLSYGPMVDEVELIDDSLVRPSLLPDDAEGPIRGFDIMRFQAYESVALRSALNRIEDLEARIDKLTDALCRQQLEQTLEVS